MPIINYEGDEWEVNDNPCMTSSTSNEYDAYLDHPTEGRIHGIAVFKEPMFGDGDFSFDSIRSFIYDDF